MTKDNRSTTPKGVGSKPWLPVRIDLADDPRSEAIRERCALSAESLEASLPETLEAALVEVAQLRARLDALGLSAIVGATVRYWSHANLFSADGSLPYFSRTHLDRKVGIPGFADAIASVSWLESDETGITVPDFEVWNGQSAKRRAQANVRQQRKRIRDAESDPHATVTHNRDKNVTKEEDRRVNNNPPPPSVPLRSRQEGEGKNSDGADAWAEVLSQPEVAGLADALGMVEAARGKGLTPANVLAVIAEYRVRKAEFRSPGAIHWRITRGTWPDNGTGPNLDAKRHEHLTAKTAELFAEGEERSARVANERLELDRLQKELEADLDALAAEELEQLVPDGPARITLRRFGWRAPLVRSQVLRRFHEVRSTGGNLS